MHIRYSRPDPGDIEGEDFDSQGRVDIDLLKQVLPFDDYDFYLCGPTPFMRSLYCGLRALRVPEDRIHYEFFGPASVLKEDTVSKEFVAGPTAETELAGGPKVTFARSGVTASWDPQCENILEFAEHHGLNPPFSCRSGICSTCKSPLLEGQVAYVEEPLDQPEEGSVLICCSRPTTDIIVDV